MRQWIFLVVASLLTVATKAQQPITDGEVEYRNVAPFRKIRVGDGIELILTQAEKVTVAASASRPEYLRQLKTEVVQDELKLYYNRESLSDWTATGKKLKVFVSVNRLEQLTAATGASVRVEGALKAATLQMDLRSGASFRGNLQASKLVIAVETGARAQLEGKADALFVQASSGGRVEAYDVAADTADVKVSTGAVVQTSAVDTFVLQASTGGSIRYKGKARIAVLNIRSGGTVRPFNE